MKALILDLLNQLLDLILKERELITSSKKPDDLMSLLPQKLSLLEQIDSLSSKEAILHDALSDEHIKEILRNIKKENEFNRLFIEELSELYAEISSVISPALYNSRGKRETFHVKKGANVSLEA